MNVDQVKKEFIEFFKSKGHQEVESASLIPANDPTLLFVNAGMVPFKDYFTGIKTPPHRRATSIQKCVRAGGKHNDLENVGFTARHHTFFEMLGNFSFGDYFKKDAIIFAWEFLTQTLKLDPSRLYISVHESDHEAYQLWQTEVGVDKERIFFRGDKDNFWSMGETGPCGPSSEIFYDHGVEYTDPALKGQKLDCLLDDELRYVEIWNLVFMQFERYLDESGKLQQRELPSPSVDTGAGLERLMACMDQKYNNYDTSLFEHLRTTLENLTGLKYEKALQPMRVVLDHIRSVTFLLSDGVLPSNEGRGYVLRRIIRRAVRFLDLMGVQEATLYKLAPHVIQGFESFYPEMKNKESFVVEYLKSEEESFRRTLKEGLRYLQDKIDEMEKSERRLLSGDDAFVLFDTHGLPLDLTQMILKEQGLKLDEERFHELMTEQRERSKRASSFHGGEKDQAYFKFLNTLGTGEQKFVGYDTLELEASFLGGVLKNESTHLFFDQTPFYPEGGGQRGDIGLIEFQNQAYKVLDTQKVSDGKIAHIIGESLKSFPKIGEKAHLKVDQDNRDAIKAHHSATHLLQEALIQVLGDHVNQAGSSVVANRLRFDFTHPKAMTYQELQKVQELINQKIHEALSVEAKIMTKDEAQKSGAKALFGEKYGESVRVIDMFGFSKELCGGTHVKNTKDIGAFLILQETSLATGVRRIEAVCHHSAQEVLMNEYSKMKTLTRILENSDVISQVQKLQNDLKNKDKELKNLKQKLQDIASQALMAKSLDDLIKTKSSYHYFEAELSSDHDLRRVADELKNKYKDSLFFLWQSRQEKKSFLVTTNLKALKLNLIVKAELEKQGAKGGGRPDLVQGAIESLKFDVFYKGLKSALLEL